MCDLYLEIFENVLLFISLLECSFKSHAFCHFFAGLLSIFGKFVLLEEGTCKYEVA